MQELIYCNSKSKAKEGKEVVSDAIVQTHRFGNDRFQGSLDCNGNRHGVGTYIWKSGAVFQGNFREGLMHGAGRMTYSNGDVFVGEWVDGLIAGPGLKKTMSNGSVEEGEYHEGEGRRNDGKATIVRRRFDNGDRFCGEITKEDVREGYGEYFWADGYVYRGFWENDRTHGVGHWEPQLAGCPTQFSFCRSFSGTFHEELRQGYGVAELWELNSSLGVSFKHSAKQYEGWWAADMFHGVGKLTYSPFPDSDNPSVARVAIEAGGGTIGAAALAAVVPILRVEVDGEFRMGQMHGLVCVRQVLLTDGARIMAADETPPRLATNAFIGECDEWNLRVALDLGHDVLTMAHLLRGFEFRGEFEHDEAMAGTITSDTDEAVETRVRRVSPIEAEPIEWHIF